MVTECFSKIIPVMLSLQLIENVNPSHPNSEQREKDNFKFHFHLTLWCLKRFCEDLKGLHKNFWGTTKKCENKDLKLLFILIKLFEMQSVGECWINVCFHIYSLDIALGKLAYQGVRNVSFFWKCGLRWFLVTSVWRFAFLSYYWWVVLMLYLTQQYLASTKCFITRYVSDSIN